MAEKKLSTAEILAKARADAKSAQGDSVEAGASAEEAAPAEAAPSAPATSSEPAKPKAKPGSTSDILAAARASAAAKAGGEAPSKEAAPSKPAAAKPAAGKKPTSTADILAAARAQAGAGAKEAATSDSSAAPAAKASKKAVAPIPAGERPSVQEMLKAVREGKAPEVEEATAKPKAPVIPQRPVKKPAADKQETRRSFLASFVITPFAVAWASLAVVTTGWVLGVARFMFPNVLIEPPTKFKIGPPSDYPLGTVSTKWKAARGIWIVHTDQYKGENLLYALISVCTHLGCTPNWLEGEQKFKCPCHGSGFYVTGVNFEGPAPRPLERCGISLAADGMLEVDKSVKFQEEMGQWQDAASFVDATTV